MVSLLLISIIDLCFKPNWKPLSNINILSDVFNDQKNKKPLPLASDSIHLTVDVSSEKIYQPFSIPNRLTEYYKDTSSVVLKNFITKLADLKQGRRKKIRIAFLGDSMIEEDFVTLTLRKLLQQEFGGYGIGYLPMSSKLSCERATANIYASNTWNEFNFRSNPNNNPLYIFGRCFKANGNAFTQIEDKTVPPNLPLHKCFLVGKNDAEKIVMVNGIKHPFAAKEKFNCLVLDSGIGNKVRFEMNDIDNIFGVSLESPTGITVDNFSFRGISGYEFCKMDSAFLSNISKQHPYDLIIMQYGVNIFEKPNDNNFNWYFKPMKKAISRIKSSFPDANILIVSTADRAFRYGDDYETATGMPNLISFQEKLAFETNVGFYNTFSSMGGEGSMVRWVESDPPLAYKDYMHPNDRGSEIIGKSIYDAITYEYRKMINKKN